MYCTHSVSYPKEEVDQVVTALRAVCIPRDYFLALVPARYSIADNMSLPVVRKTIA